MSISRPENPVNETVLVAELLEAAQIAREIEVGVSCLREFLCGPCPAADASENAKPPQEPPLISRVIDLRRQLARIISELAYVGQRLGT